MEVSRITHLRNGNKDYIRLYGYDENGNPIKQLK
jgi:hypothetical protein